MRLKNKLNVGGTFTICAPDGYKAKYEDSGETFTLQLGDDFRPIYIKRFELQKSVSTIDKLRMFLHSEAKRGGEAGRAREMGKRPNYSLEDDLVEGLLYSQAVIHVDNFHWWITRTVGVPQYPYYFLIHWIGNRSELSLGIAVVASFEIGSDPQSIKTSS